MTYNNITITESAKGFSFDMVTYNFLRPNTYRKNANTMMTLAQIKSVIDYYLNLDADVQNGIVYLGKAKVAK